MKFFFLFLFVPFIVFAAPREETQNNDDGAKKLIQIDKTVEGQKVEKADFFYTDSQSITIHGGAAYVLTSEYSLVYGIWGLTYTFPSQTRFHFESSFDIFANQEGHFRVMGRWGSRISEKVRPFVNAGLGLKVLPNDNVGVILSWGRMLAQLGTGVEWSFTQHTSLRLEAFGGVDLSLNSYAAFITGYSLSF